MLRRTISALILVAALFATTGAALAEKRVALVIGNSAYKHAPELANPKNDAADMVAALKALGLTVIEGIDLDKRAMDRTIRDFSVALSGAEVGVFFYAGHGMQVSGTNYLVPVDAELSTASALEFEMVRFDLVQRIMEGEAKTNILFLDACRNNPLSRNLARAMGTRSPAIGKGLAAAESGLGTLISFSTQPGNVALDGVGRNSPYTGPLVKALAQPGEDLISILTKVRNEVLVATADKQIPWENHALRSRFYFKPAAAVPQTPSPPSRTSNVNPADAERAWSASKDANDPLVLEAFLRRFGDSFYADLARSKLGELNRAAASADKGSDRTIVDANKVVELEPRSAMAYFNRGLAFRRKKEIDRSIGDYNTAIDLDPNHALSYFERAFSYAEKNDQDRAIADNTRAIELNPKYIYSHFNRGVAFGRKSEFDRAIDDYTKTAQLDPGYVPAYYNRGYAYLDKKEKDIDKAFADFSKAIELDPKGAIGYRGRGYCHIMKKDYDAAIADYTHSIQLDAKSTIAFYNRGWTYEQKKDIDHAAADYNKALEVDPNYIEARNALKRIGRAP
jgi:tetratricopeptide (TPR) repeat protein